MGNIKPELVVVLREGWPHIDLAPTAETIEVKAHLGQFPELKRTLCPAANIKILHLGEKGALLGPQLAPAALEQHFLELARWVFRRLCGRLRLAAQQCRHRGVSVLAVKLSLTGALGVPNLPI